MNDPSFSIPRANPAWLASLLPFSPPWNIRGLAYIGSPQLLSRFHRRYLPRKRMTTQNYNEVHADIVALLDAARTASVRSVNALMTATYWEIGRRIVELEQQGEARTDYGEQLVERLAKDLTRRFGRGFGRPNLWQMRAFYQARPPQQILQTPSGESVTPSLTGFESASSSITAVAGRFPPALVRICPSSFRQAARGPSILRD
jgi:hypothetical protein